jgi:uncharacterized membrane protein YqaE (UPF0057 family)
MITNINLSNKQYNIFINDKNYILDIFDIINVKKIKTINELIIYLQNNYTNTKNEYLSLFKNYFILFNNKLISNDTNLYTLFNQKDTETHEKYEKYYIFELIEKQNGGGIISSFMSIIKIGEFFVQLGKFIEWLLKFILWFVRFMIWFFMDFLNPVNLIGDFYKSIMLITITICRAPFELIMASFKICINILGGWMQGFWGWDQSSVSKRDRDSNYFKKIQRSKGKKCYLTSSNTIPFSIILGTILCPPIGVFMDLGLTGWLNIIICVLLTLLFYLPGLVYALLVIYS